VNQPSSATKPARVSERDVDSAELSISFLKFKTLFDHFARHENWRTANAGHVNLAEHRVMSCEEERSCASASADVPAHDICATSDRTVDHRSATWPDAPRSMNTAGTDDGVRISRKDCHRQAHHKA
jgi:hypothetical protein